LSAAKQTKAALAMTTLLQQAFAAAAQLPAVEQDLLASRLLAELAEEEAFDQAIAQSAPRLADLARAAIAEHRALDCGPALVSPTRQRGTGQKLGPSPSLARRAKREPQVWLAQSQTVRSVPHRPIQSYPRGAVPVRKS